MNYNIDDVLLCKVKKIEGTSVFLETENGFPGSMILSEVAAGRIRNLRQYVSLNRTVVCKILEVKGDHLELSLRRVTAKERQYVLENNKRERAFASMLKVVGEEPEKIIERIKNEKDIGEFLDEAKEDIKILEKYLGKEKALKLFKVLGEKEERERKVDKQFVLRSDSENGVEDIKEILDFKEAEIHYLGGGKFSLSIKANDFKEANMKMDKIVEEIRKRAEKKKAVFELKGK
ncbi:hypothetical protein J4462_01235 [Candidatus Pacearchaeota archaeon]|nr:hypothetical protein [Candidatus Pacearchaeota archaeon]